MIKSYADIDKSQLRGIVRRVDSLGRILAPVEYRKELGLEQDDKIDIAVLEDGMFVRPLREGDPGFLAARRIDNLGRVNIPVAVRRALDIAFFDELEMFLLRDGIYIRKKVS